MGSHMGSDIRVSGPMYFVLCIFFSAVQYGVCSLTSYSICLFDFAIGLHADHEAPTRKHKNHSAGDAPTYIPAANHTAHLQTLESSREAKTHEKEESQGSLRVSKEGPVLLCNAMLSHNASTRNPEKRPPGAGWSSWGPQENDKITWRDGQTRSGGYYSHGVMVCTARCLLVLLSCRSWMQ